MTTTMDTAQQTAKALLAVPAHAMGAALRRSSEFGLEPYELYVLGRGGPMGPVAHGVVTAALGFLEPSFVEANWTSATAKMPIADGARAWASIIAGWGEENLPDDLPLERVSDLLGRCISAVSPGGAPTFSGWRTHPLPANPGARAMHQLYALREYRGAVHLGAVLAAGLRPIDALLIRTPPLARMWGWSDDEVATDVSHLVDTWWMAEEGTDRAVARFFEPLDPIERRELVAGVNVILDHTGMNWWFEDGSPTIRFDPKPTARNQDGS